MHTDITILICYNTHLSNSILFLLFHENGRSIYVGSVLEFRELLILYWEEVKNFNIQSSTNS